MSKIPRRASRSGREKPAHRPDPDPDFNELDALLDELADEAGLDDDEPEPTEDGISFNDGGEEPEPFDEDQLGDEERDE